MGWGYPGQVQAGAVPQPGPARGVPHPRYPPSDLARGVPHLKHPIRPGQGVTPVRRTPPWVPLSELAWGVPLPGVPHLGYPPIRPGQGVPHLGSPSSDLAGGVPCQGGTPPWVTPSQTWLGGTPAGGGTPPQVTDGVLDTPRSVCLLRSRRRTFLLNVKLHLGERVFFNCSLSYFGFHVFTF